MNVGLLDDRMRRRTRPRYMYSNHKLFILVYLTSRRSRPSWWMDRVSRIERSSSSNGRKIGGVAVRNSSRTLTFSTHDMLDLDLFSDLSFTLRSCCSVVRTVRHRYTYQHRHNASEAVYTVSYTPLDKQGSTARPSTTGEKNLPKL
jgi:hypothetical protein